MQAFLLKWFPICALAVAALSSTYPLHAQCTVTGQVLDLSLSGNCGLAILEYQNFNLLVPSDTTLGLSEGMEINFSYEVSQQTSPCAAATLVDITCLEFVADPLVACDATFSFSPLTGSSVQILFQPLVQNGNLTYFWDFGDGNISTLSTPYHTFQPGTYEVCLTTTGGACAQATHCQMVDLQSCAASFVHAVSTDGTVAFENTSTGNFTYWQWETGDGEVLLNESLTVHQYDTVGIFTACLTVWDGYGCYSKFCDYVFSGTGDVCEFTDCVLPGDTDADGLASVYDLLPIGIGYGSEGPDRQGDPLANIAWSPQFAPDWGLSTATGIDYKHLDCNGDGQIDEFDADIIGMNYQEPGNYLTAQTTGAAQFWLDFDWDTVVIEDGTPPLIELEADLVAGTSQVPFDNLRGFALQLEYPAYLVADNGITANYNSNSFFGSSNGVLWLGKNRPEAGRYDLGFTRKTTSAGGFGDVAKLKFIVIADVIARGQIATPFTIKISDMVAVNPDGEVMALGPAIEEATVVIINKTTSSTGEKWLDSQVALFPNPASDILNLVLSDLQADQLEVFNAIGQIIHHQSLDSKQTTIHTGKWGRGIYFVKVRTQQGTIVKKVAVE